MSRFTSLHAVLFAVVAAFLLAACDLASPELDAPDPSAPDAPLGGLTAPESFDFATSQPVGLTLTEATAGVPTRYDVWRIGTDGARHYLGAGMADASGQTTLPFALPTATERLIVRRNAAGDESETEVAVTAGQASYAFAGAGSRANGQCSDVIVAVNKNKDHFLADYETFSETTMPTLPEGTYGMAVDPIGRAMYFTTIPRINGSHQLVRYDLDTQVYTTVGPSIDSHAMAFDPQRGVLVSVMRGEMTTIDPATGAALQTWTLRDVDTPTGGDVMINVNGEVFFSRNNKLWRIDDVDATTKQGVLIRSLPMNPTGGTVGADGFLYLVADKTLYRVDPVSGDLQQIHTLSRLANDLDFLPCATGPSYNQDQDGDGVPDVFDDMPNDPTVAFERFMPAQNQFGALAFEDLWPSTGDYDFNDLVVSYRYRELSNASGEVVRLAAEYVVQAVGAGYRNGFGVELPVAASDVARVTYSHAASSVTLGANGTEAGHTNAVLIPFDDAKDMVPGAAGFVNTEPGSSVLPGDTVKVDVTFAAPRPGSLLLDAPYNPFLFRTDDRGREVHLPDAAPTALADTERFGTRQDRTNVSGGTTYRTEAGLPWALHLAEGFAHPLEKRDLTQGYPRFAQWVQSSGASYPDWYGARHRVASHLFGQE
ncbi:MAG: LruC domain-containing protein [Bacteroidota bacterium]